MNEQVTWGILGTGDIARQMAEDLRLVPGAYLRAVASRTPERAEAFGALHDIPVRYGDYHVLAQDPAIDVVYIATPHPRHYEDTLLCLEHGKHVLCEKPLAMNAAQVESMIQAASRRSLFLMEALWTAFFPAMQGAMSDVHSGRIGDPRLVTADFSYKAAYNPESRLFNPALGGGALLDIGIYTVTLADMVFEVEPDRICSFWTPSPTGVDESAAIMLEYGEGRRALLSTSLAFDAPQVARVAGTEGVIEFPHRFSQPDTYHREICGQQCTFSFPRMGFGYHLEAAAVTASIRAGRTAHEAASWERSLRIARTLDRIRAGWGLRYPADEALH